jgi:hypothetical protein
MTLSISWQWLSSIHESPEIRETGAKLKITLGREVLTRNVDEWSKTVSDDVRLSAYPLALWLASSWWRLRWEPLPTTFPSLSWRMSHELAAAGYGYVWPRVLFASDGEAVQVWAAPSAEGEPSPVNFLTGTHGVVLADDFERSIDTFLGGVIARLGAVGIAETTLQNLVAELAEERADANLAAYRRLEAIAGFDPGEGPPGILDQLEALIPRAGLSAAQEMATLCASAPSEQVLADAVRIAGEAGLRAKPTEVVAGEALHAGVDRYAPAWVRGKDLALSLRRRLVMNGQPISDADLYDIMGITPQQIANSASQVHAPLGLAVRDAHGHLELHPRRRSSTAFRFELARYLCDHAMACESDHWLPVTDGKTSRQKAQRAFAAEFLCPIDGLTSYLGDDLSDDAMEDAANHFRVGPLAVRTQLVNNGILPRELLPDFDRDGSFPYWAE